MLVASSTPTPGAVAAATVLAVLDAPQHVPLPAVPAEPRALDILVPDAAPAGVVLATSPLATSPLASAKEYALPFRPTVVQAATRPAKLWAQLRRGLTVRGAASWYWGSRGHAGIAHVAMPGARFLAKGGAAPRARVCADGRCTIVRVVDACSCHVGTSRARLVDLSAMTLQRLGLDASRGIYRVRVTLLSS